MDRDSIYLRIDFILALIRLWHFTTGAFILLVLYKLTGKISELKHPKLNQYEVSAYQKNGKMMALSFFDKRVVSMVSKYHNPATENVTRIRKKGVSETYDKPKVIIEYTKYMGGVDRADHYCAPGGRHETSFYCETCTRQPGLHPGMCFKKYHTERKYK